MISLFSKNPMGYKSLLGLALVTLLATSCSQSLTSDDFEEAESPQTLTAAHLTFENSSISGSFEPLPDGNKLVTCQFTNFIGEQEVVASILAPGTSIEFLAPTTEGSTPALSITLDTQSEFEATYIVEDSSFFDLKFMCRGEVRKDDKSKIEEDVVRFFQLKSLFGGVRGGNLVNLNSGDDEFSILDSLGTSFFFTAPNITTQSAEVEPFADLFGDTAAQACVSDEWVYYFNDQFIARGEHNSTMVQKFAGNVAAGAPLQNRLLLNIEELKNSLSGEGSASRTALSCEDEKVTLWFRVTGDTADSVSPDSVFGIEFLDSNVVPVIHRIATAAGSTVLQYPKTSPGFAVLRDAAGIYKANTDNQRFDEVSAARLASELPELDSAVEASSAGESGFSYAKFAGTNSSGYLFLSAGIFRVCPVEGSCTDDVRVELQKKRVSATESESLPIKTQVTEFAEPLVADSEGFAGNSRRIMQEIILDRDSYEISSQEILRITGTGGTITTPEFELEPAELSVVTVFGQHHLDADSPAIISVEDDTLSYQPLTPLGLDANQTKTLAYSQLFESTVDRSIDFISARSILGRNKGDASSSASKTASIYSFDQGSEVHDVSIQSFSTTHQLANNFSYIDSSMVLDFFGFPLGIFKFSYSEVSSLANDQILLAPRHPNAGAGFYRLAEGQASPTVVSSPAGGTFDPSVYLYNTSFSLSRLEPTESEAVENYLDGLNLNLEGCANTVDLLRGGDGYINYIAECDDQKYVHQFASDGSYFQQIFTNASSVATVGGSQDHMLVAYQSTTGSSLLRLIRKDTGAFTELNLGSASGTENKVTNAYLGGQHLYFVRDHQVFSSQIELTGAASISNPNLFFGDKDGHLDGGCSLSSQDFLSVEIDAKANNLERFCDGAILGMHLLRKGESNHKMVVVQALNGNLNVSEININDL